MHRGEKIGNCKIMIGQTHPPGQDEKQKERNDTTTPSLEDQAEKFAITCI